MNVQEKVFPLKAETSTKNNWRKDQVKKEIPIEVNIVSGYILNKATNK